ncbi:MAG TPA: hypothetical protein VF057_14175 [Thermoanaerobaculia bacterium]
MRCTIDVHDSTLIGHAADLSVVRKVVVHDSRAINKSDIVLRRDIARLDRRTVIELHRATLQAFSYSGEKISIEIHSELRIDDGALFDTTLTEQEQLDIGSRPSVADDAKSIVQPGDAFNFAKNLAAIPPLNRAITIGLVLIGSIVIAINSWIGWHDQFAPAPMTYFYDHRDSDGESESPLQKSLMASGALGAAIWLAIRKQLRKYMTFELHGVPQRICRGDVLRASTLLRGRARVPLENITVRIVACNMELGQYQRGSGTKKRTVSFKEPVRAVILYEQHVARVPAGHPVERYLAGEVAFEPMFRALYPPQMVGAKHGLALYWEVQLIHDDFIDQEVVGPVECFPWKDFLAA